MSSRPICCTVTPRRRGKLAPPMLWGLAGGGTLIGLLLVWLVGRSMFASRDAGPGATARQAPRAVATFDAGRLRPAAPVAPLPGVDPAPLGDVLANLSAAGPLVLNTLDDPDLAEMVRSGQRRADKAAADTSAAHNWEFRFLRGQTAASYARQLDHFRIELAVVQPKGDLLYVSNLSDEQPVTRTGRVEDERRYYLTWRGGELSHADIDVLSRARVEGRNRVILKLLPADLEAKLVQLERAHAGPKADRVRKTRFEIRPEGGGYAIHVVEQWYN